MTIDASHPKIKHVLKEPNEVLPAIRMAKPGERIVYYEGYLNVATLFDLRSAETWQKQLLFLAGQMYELAVAGEVHLYQKRKSDWNYVYIAERAREDWKKTSQYKLWMQAIEVSKKKGVVSNSDLNIRPRMGRPPLKVVESVVQAVA